LQFDGETGNREPQAPREFDAARLFSAVDSENTKIASRKLMT